MLLPQIEEMDRYQILSLGAKPVVLYDNHRWVLPVISAAHSKDFVSIPCTMVIFDQHHDALVLKKGLDEILKIRNAGRVFEDIVEMVDSHLSTLNDDWLRAGMELGLIGDAIVFGVKQNTMGVEEKFRDSTGVQHQLFFPGLPGSGLRHQGDLSDLARKYEVQALWDCLGWVPGNFVEGRDPIVLDFDLDCFAVYWENYVFPWPDEVFEKEFLKPSDYPLTKGLTGRDIMKGLLCKAGLVTVAREPLSCGGADKAEQIFQSLNKYLFDNDLVPPA